MLICRATEWGQRLELAMEGAVVQLIQQGTVAWQRERHAHSDTAHL